MLLILFQRAQTNLGQSNPLSELYQMNMQLNLLKRLAQNNSSTTNSDTEQMQLLKALAVQGQQTELQIPKLQSPHTLNIIKQNKILQGPQSEDNKRKNESLRETILLRKEASSLDEIKSENSTKIPQLGNFNEKTEALSGDDNSEDRQKSGLSSKSKKM